MKIKCGVDIIEISRVKESIESLGERFINRVFRKSLYRKRNRIL